MVATSGTGSAIEMRDDPAERVRNAKQTGSKMAVASHDGLGGQLTSIIAMSRMGESNPQHIEASAEATLGDLRMVIGSLDVQSDISGMLGTFRERAEQQLAAHDIEPAWCMIDIPEIEGMPPSRALNILRIMQEATTNAAKHSGADRITIGFDLEDEPASCLRIKTDDIGNGFGSHSAEGYGLQNMRGRAWEIGGDLDVRPLEDGLRVALRVPTKIG